MPVTVKVADPADRFADPMRFALSLRAIMPVWGPPTKVDERRMFEPRFGVAFEVESISEVGVGCGVVGAVGSGVVGGVGGVGSVGRGVVGASIGLEPVIETTADVLAANELLPG